MVNGYITKVCIQCKQKFVVFRYRNHTAKFCSNACHAKYKFTLDRINRYCKVCKTNFLALPSSSKVYCSHDCYLKARSFGWYATKRQCLRCHQVFVAHSKKRKFCSFLCSSKFPFDSKWKANHIPWNKGVKGVHFSPKTEFKVGRKFKHNQETKEKISHQKKILYQDKTKHPSWRGGLSGEIYPFEFTKDLKMYIRCQYGNICQLCCKFLNKLLIHHIDYNKKNNTYKNLIPLCRGCHAKTNYNRLFWEQYFYSRNVFDYPEVSWNILQNNLMNNNISYVMKN